MAKKVAEKKGRRRNLARDLVTLVRAFDRLDQARDLICEARNILNDDRLKLPQLDEVRARVRSAEEFAEMATDPFNQAFVSSGERRDVPQFSEEYFKMTSASYKGGPGEVD